MTLLWILLKHFYSYVFYIKESEPPPPAPEATTEGQTTTEQNGEAEKTDDKDGDSSDDDDLTVTIGELKKAAEVMTPAQQQHQARFQPKVNVVTIKWNPKLIFEISHHFCYNDFGHFTMLYITTYFSSDLQIYVC